MGKKEKINKKNDGTGGGQQANNGFPQEVVGDTRFSRVHNDPRFQRLPKHRTKVPIDSRFAHMFHDKGFADKEVDKRGGSKKSNKQKQLLRRYYEYDEKDEEQAEPDTDSDDQVGKDLLDGKQKGTEKRKKRNVLPESESDGEVDEESHEDESEQELPTKAKAGEVVGTLEVEGSDGELDADSDEEEGSGLDEDGEDEESSSSSSSSSESESEAEEESNTEEKVPTTDQETKRLALMNMDWNHIRAVDLLVVLRSFQPKGGNVESVTIYPSEFGVEKMAKEASQGPQGIFTHDDVDESEDEADPEKLREYEKAKLRYYYAVALCDSVVTASCIYNSCDGLEYEKTANTLDLRFIPDEIKFMRQPKDSATDVPNDYKPVEFETKALQHSRVKLTWDDDEPLRAKALRRKFNADQLNEQDYRDYIGSSSSSDSKSESEADEVSDEEKANGEEKQKLRKKYLSLLSDTKAEEGNIVGKNAEKGNIEIKFNTGLDELSEKLTEKMKKANTDETVWEAYLRKKKEKRKARKNKSKDDNSDFSDEDGQMSSDGGAPTADDPFFSHGEDPFSDPFFQDNNSVPSKGNNAKELKGSTKIGTKFASSAEEKKKKKEEVAQEKKEEARRKAELELLLMDDDLVQNGGAVAKSKNDSVETDKKVKKKKKKGKEKAEGVQEKLAAAANYEDPRFSNLFNSHHFAIDPTDPQFKKSAAQLSTIAEKQRHRLERRNASRTDQEDPETGSGGRKRKAELSSLVRSLKSKVQARK